MSNAAINWAFALSLDSPNDKLVLMSFANRANGAGKCWPKVETVATETGLSVRSVQRSIRRLTGGGHMAVEGIGGRGRHSLYTLKMVTAETPFAEEKRVTLVAETVTPVVQRVKTCPQKGDNVSPPIDEPKVEPIEPREPIGRGHDLLGDTPHAKRSAKVGSKRVRLHSDWAPDADDRAHALALRLDVGHEAEKFRNYHLSRGNLMADWHAAWRMWCGNAVTFAARDRASEERIGQRRGADARSYGDDPSVNRRATLATLANYCRADGGEVQ